MGHKQDRPEYKDINPLLFQKNFERKITVDDGCFILDGPMGSNAQDADTASTHKFPPVIITSARTVTIRHLSPQEPCFTRQRPLY